MTKTLKQLPTAIRGFLEYPRESIQCELKSWLDPAKNEYDRAVIGKGCMALRNADGGVLILGIRDDGSPAKQPDGYDPTYLFNTDSVQAIIHEYAAEKFEIDLYVVNESAAAAVVIVVPGGLTTPVVCRKTFEHKRVKLQEGIIYTRTFRSNNTISSAAAQ